MQDDILTIAITSYNYAHYIKDAVESVINQTSSQWQLVIYDNCSTDNTVDVLKPYLDDKRIKLFIHEKNIGGRENGQFATRHADTEFFSILQADDFLEKTFVEMALYQLNKYPSAPFVFFNWHQYMDDSKTSFYHNRFPFSANRSGPLLIGPFLTVCNFVPLHMAVFRRNCLEKYYDLFIESPLNQVGEQYILKLLEDEYGCGCYTGTLGGVWRRHGQQMTAIQTASLTAMIEEPIERHWYATRAPNPNPINTFMALVNFITSCAHVDYFTAANWLLNTDGIHYAKSFGIPAETERKRLQGIVLVVASKYSTYTGINLCEQYDIKDWLIKMNSQSTINGLEFELERVMEREGEIFLNFDEIREICFKFSENERKAKDAYGHWCERRQVGEGWAEIIGERMVKRWQNQPTFHLVIWCEPSQQSALADTLESLEQQFYKQWGLSILAPFDCPNASLTELPNFEWVRVEVDADAALQNTLNASALDWFALLEPGDRLAPHALLKAADYTNRYPAWRFIYLDEDELDAHGKRRDPVFRPEFDPDLLFATHYLGDFCLMQRNTVLAGGDLPYLPGLTTFQAALRVWENQGRSAIGHIADVLYHRTVKRLPPVDGELVAQARRQLVLDSLTRRSITATVEQALLPGTWRVSYHHAMQPKVSIIILAKDALEWLDRCLRTLLTKTTYPDYEVLVIDCGSEVEDTLDLYTELEARYPHRFRVAAAQGPFSVSAYRNQGVQQTQGEVLIFLTSSAMVVQANWIDRLLNHALRDEIGVVGARLTVPEKSRPFVQGTAQVLGMGSIVGPLFTGLLMKDPGPFGRAQVDQTVSAVSADCLMIRRSVFEAVGGFDDRFTIVYADTDLCLRTTGQGYRSVWTPFANLAWLGEYPLATGFRHEEQTDRLRADTERMYERWLPQLAADPHYNLNLSLAAPHQVEVALAPGWDTTFHDRPRLLGFPVDESGCGLYRVYAPLWLLEHQAYAECTLAKPGTRPPELAELERLAPDTVFYQTTLSDSWLKTMQSYRRFHRSFKVFDLDDLKHDVPDANSLKERLMRDMKYRHRMALRECDRLIVSTEPLAEVCRPWIGDIRVVPNRLERARWTHLHNQRRAGPKPRVGWAGAQQHHGDLAFLIEVIKQTCDEIDWVFLGMCLDEIRPCVKEVHDWVSLNTYPDKLASLNLDLAVAPLELHPFNEAKSNLRILEHGILGRPMVCTDIHPYRNAPVTRVPNEIRAWVEAIRAHTYDLDAAEREGDALRAWVLEHYILDDHTEDWLRALTP